MIYNHHVPKPWFRQRIRPVDEKQLEKDARRTLKKNGIKDPSGQDVDMEQLGLGHTHTTLDLDWTC